MHMKQELIQNKKVQEGLDGVPQQLFDMLTYCVSLKFQDQPDYKYLKSMLQKVIKKFYSIKKITDIDIVNNNFEHKETPAKKFELMRADVDIS